MTIEEYRQKRKELRERHWREEKELAKEYALANNPYSIGDLVTDHIGSIKIEKIQISEDISGPCCVYYGLELKKDGTPTKRGEKRHVYQTNIDK